MEKYLQSFKSSFSVYATYRGAVFIKLFRNILAVVFFVTLWQSILHLRGNVSGYTLPIITTYYFLARLLDELYTYEPTRTMTGHIKTGDLSGFLVKPGLYFFFIMFNAAGRRLARTSLFLLTVFAVFLLLPNFFVWPTSFVSILLFLFSFLISWITLYEISFIIGCFGFWISETSNIRGTIEQLALLLGGIWIPLDLLPNEISKYIKLLPFQYLYFFPIQVFQERIKGLDLEVGLFTQIIWLWVFFLLSWYLYKKGIRKFEAYGK